MTTDRKTSTTPGTGKMDREWLLIFFYSSHFTLKLFSTKTEFEIIKRPLFYFSLFSNSISRINFIQKNKFKSETAKTCLFNCKTKASKGATPPHSDSVATQKLGPKVFKPTPIPIFQSSCPYFQTHWQLWGLTLSSWAQVLFNSIELTKDYFSL